MQGDICATCLLTPPNGHSLRSQRPPPFSTRRASHGGPDGVGDLLAQPSERLTEVFGLCRLAGGERRARASTSIGRQAAGLTATAGLYPFWFVFFFIVLIIGRIIYATLWLLFLPFALRQKYKYPGEYAAARTKKKEYRLDFVLSKLPAASGAASEQGGDGDGVGR
jgi:hypothetical protein